MNRFSSFALLIVLLSSHAQVARAQETPAIPEWLEWIRLGDSEWISLLRVRSLLDALGYGTERFVTIELAEEALPSKTLPMLPGYKTFILTYRVDCHDDMIKTVDAVAYGLGSQPIPMPMQKSVMWLPASGEWEYRILAWACGRLAPETARSSIDNTLQLLNGQGPLTDVLRKYNPDMPNR